MTSARDGSSLSATLEDEASPGNAGIHGHSRLLGIDLARGIALLAMAVYHGAWDASHLGLTSVDVVNDPGWRLFARAIAASFLLLVGFSLVLAHGSRIRWQAFLRRLAVIVAAAAAITIVTFFAFPQSYIFFGILHCIALSSLLALPFLRLPPAVAAAAGIAVVAAPGLVASPLFDLPALAFVGLGTQVPVSNDYVPLFPWFGPVLLGMAAGRLAVDRNLTAWLQTSRTPGLAGRLIAWTGRHSLAFYLVHQPVLFGLMFLAAHALGITRQPSVAAGFVPQCRASCEQTGVAAAACKRYCTCADAAIRQERIDLADASADTRGRVTAIVNRCRTGARQ
ncbi:DUF1624 domain-containing protein [Chelatococcus daeguensis]|uniref:heparan-alpha-glucosaminide N-acetyltransferase n=1 Tax=Chelatococcus daeguensis TaxID=444444 RepID=UPI000AFEFA1F|nr:heparan-alpha-glucosaminide N-acetyltransferase [Chelatococcus daeguensis]MBM3085543.1 DUF1624 domain-containing protein [Chelatococcus daeguensis]